MSIQERLDWRITPEQYETIRTLWIAHSKAEEARDLQGLIDTLTPDCVYELVPTGRRWTGHEGRGSSTLRSWARSPMCTSP